MIFMWQHQSYLVFTTLSSLFAFYRKASLNLIKKMVHYIQPSLLVEACSPESPTYNFGTMLVEVIATVLDNEVRKFDYKLHEKRN
jgi:hypothetical protein